MYLSESSCVPVCAVLKQQTAHPRTSHTAHFLLVATNILTTPKQNKNEKRTKRKERG